MNIYNYAKKLTSSNRTISKSALRTIENVGRLLSAVCLYVFGPWRKTNKKLSRFFM